MSMQFTPFYGYYIREYLSNVFTIDESRKIEEKIIRTTNQEIYCEDDCVPHPKYLFGIFAEGDLNHINDELKKYEKEGTFKELIVECMDNCGFTDKEKENIKFLLDNYEPVATVTSVYL